MASFGNFQIAPKQSSTVWICKQSKIIIGYIVCKQQILRNIANLSIADYTQICHICPPMSSVSPYRLARHAQWPASGAFNALLCCRSIRVIRLFVLWLKYLINHQKTLQCGILSRQRITSTLYIYVYICDVYLVARIVVSCM